MSDLPPQPPQPGESPGSAQRPPPPPTQPPTQPSVANAVASGPVKTGMAVAALVLGIAGLVVCPVAASIAGLVLGIVALSRISNAPQEHGGRGMAIGGIVCGGLGLVLIIPLILVAILLPSLSRARELSKRLVCASNIKGIATTMKIYGASSADEGTPTIDILINQGMLSPRQLVCPSSGLGTSNYVLAPTPGGRGIHAEGLDNRTVILYEPKSNHGGEGGNVLFADGHVTFVRVPEFDRLIETVPRE